MLSFTLVLLRHPPTDSYLLQIDNEFVVKKHPIFIFIYILLYFHDVDPVKNNMRTNIFNDAYYWNILLTEFILRTHRFLDIPLSS
jgi:hypothetical protein